MDLSQTYHWSKGVRESEQEDVAMGNLAPPGDREESASHQIPFPGVHKGARRYDEWIQRNS